MQPHNSDQPQQTPAPSPPYQEPVQSYPPQAPQPTATASDQAAALQNVENVTQYPVDYLNQIATPLQAKKINPVILFSLIAVILLVAGVALFFLIKSSGPPNASAQLYSLQARLETLAKVTKEQGPRLTQNKISGINGTLGATIQSMQTNVKTYMDTKGIKDSKASAATKKTETPYYDKLSQTLNDAYLTGTLDRTYVSEMTFQVTILKSKLQQLKSTARSTSFNEFYDKNLPTLDTIIEQLNTFQSTK